MEEIDVLAVLPRRVLGATEGRRKPERSEGPYGAPSLCEAPERRRRSQRSSWEGCCETNYPPHVKGTHKMLDYYA